MAITKIKKVTFSDTLLSTAFDESKEIQNELKKNDATVKKSVVTVPEKNLQNLLDFFKNINMRHLTIS